MKLLVQLSLELSVSQKHTVKKLVLKNKESLLEEYLIKCKRSIMGEHISRQALHTNMQNFCLTANFPNFWIKKNGVLCWITRFIGRHSLCTY
jgi:hypothetical protein